MGRDTKIAINDFYAYLISLIFIISYTIRMFTSVNILYSNAIICFSGGLALFFLIINGNLKGKLLRSIIIIDSICIISMVINGNFAVYNIFTIITYQLISILIFFRKKVLSIFNFYFNGVIIYFIINMIIGSNPDYILNKASKNYISILLLALISLSYIYKLNENKKMMIFKCFLCLIIVFWTDGRGGILSFLFLTFGVIWILINKIFYSNKVKLINIIKWLIVGIIVLIIIKDTYTIYLENVQRVLHNEGRLGIWSLYLSNTMKSFNNFIFGTPLNDEILFLRFGKNLHNSFIGIHAQFGIIIFIVTIVYMIKLLRVYISEEDKFMIIIIISIFIRSMTDIVFFGEIIDLALYYFIIDKFNRIK